MRTIEEEIGCLSGALTRVSEGLTGEMKRVGVGPSGSLTRVSEGLTGYVSVVCTSNRSAYLTISRDTIWLTPDMIAEQFDIYSNVVWKID